MFLLVPMPGTGVTVASQVEASGTRILACTLSITPLQQRAENALPCEDPTDEGAAELGMRTFPQAPLAKSGKCFVQ